MINRVYLKIIQGEEQVGNVTDQVVANYGPEAKTGPSPVFANEVYQKPVMLLY